MVTYHGSVLIWMFYLLAPERSVLTIYTIYPRIMKSKPGTRSWSGCCINDEYDSYSIVCAFSCAVCDTAGEGAASGIKSPEDLRAQLCVVDIDAFRNLTDPAEEDFLQTHLSQRAYRKVQRQRLRATLAYVGASLKMRLS